MPVCSTLQNPKHRADEPVMAPAARPGHPLFDHTVLRLVRLAWPFQTCRAILNEIAAFLNVDSSWENSGDQWDGRCGDDPRIVANEFLNCLAL